MPEPLLIPGRTRTRPIRFPPAHIGAAPGAAIPALAAEVVDASREVESDHDVAGTIALSRRRGRELGQGCARTLSTRAKMEEHRGGARPAVEDEGDRPLCRGGAVGEIGDRVDRNGGAAFLVGQRDCLGNRAVIDPRGAEGDGVAGFDPYRPLLGRRCRRRLAPIAPTRIRPSSARNFIASAARCAV